MIKLGNCLAHRLRYSGKSVRLALIPLRREQQKSAGKSARAALADVVDWALLDPVSAKAYKAESSQRSQVQRGALASSRFFQ
jgi:hypothetical protein